MAPIPSPVQSSNSSSGKHLYHLRHQALGFSSRPLRQSSVSRTEQHKPRIPDSVDGLHPSVAPTLEPLQIRPWTPSESAGIAPEPSAVPVNSQPGDVPVNIVAAVVFVVLVLGGLVGLVIGGEMLRRRARKTSKRVSPPNSNPLGTRRSKSIKNAIGAPQQPITTGHEKFTYDGKALTTLTRPPPTLRRERRRKLSGIWPIRNLSRALCNRRSTVPVQVERRFQYLPPVMSPQTTWSEFTPVSLYAAPPRTVLDRIPEECEEDHESETSASRATLRPDSVNVCRGGGNDEDSKSLGSLAPDMTSDGGESSKLSIVSLESLEDGNDRESPKEEVFELRRAQTTSLQMNKGVLLSLSLKTLGESQSLELTDERPSRSGSPGPGGVEGGKDSKDYVMIQRELSLAILDGTFSVVDLNEFPSPLAMLPVIPSFVSGF